MYQKLQQKLKNNEYSQYKLNKTFELRSLKTQNYLIKNGYQQKRPSDDWINKGFHTASNKSNYSEGLDILNGSTIGI